MSSSTDRRDGSRTLEVTHFYGEGDGERAIETVFEEYQSAYPGMDVEATSYGNTYGLEIKARILHQDPPPVFMTWPGRDLEPYYDVGAIADLTDLWRDLELSSSFTDGTQDLVRFDGEYAAIPLDIHRKNNLFYDVELTNRTGVDPERIGGPREFLDVLDQCADADAPGLVQPMKNPWTILQLWAQIVVGLFGPDVYEEMSHGDAGSHRSEIEESVRVLAEYADRASDDAYFLDMVDANDRFVAGESVFFHQGDWVAGQYCGREGYEYGRDWDHVPFPGTDGTYVMGMDAITASPGAIDRDAVRGFLETAASAPAQEALNRTKGSIPPRRDISLDRYPRFLQDQYAEFKAARAHLGGQKSQVAPGAFVDLRDAFASFAANGDVDATVDQLVAAYETN